MYQLTLTCLVLLLAYYGVGIYLCSQNRIFRAANLFTYIYESFTWALLWPYLYWKTVKLRNKLHTVKGQLRESFNKYKGSIPPRQKRITNPGFMRRK